MILAKFRYLCLCNGMSDFGVVGAPGCTEISSILWFSDDFVVRIRRSHKGILQLQMTGKLQRLYAVALFKPKYQLGHPENYLFS